MQVRSHARPVRCGRARMLNMLVMVLALLWSQGIWPFQEASRRAHAEISLRFPETGYAVSGPFLRYWRERGGLFSYGYPISDPFNEDGLRVQYFERARFEYHPQHAGTPYEVLLSPLGLQLTAGREFQPAPRSAPAGVTYFPETRHTLRGKFLDYWHDHGGLSRFGYPISEELDEKGHDGRLYRAQYFERARLELHPENDAPYDVLLGQIGKQMMALRDRASMFVVTNGSDLAHGRDLTTLKVKGFNYFPRDYAWTDFEQWPAERVAAELDMAGSMGANTLRVFVQGDAFGGQEAGWSKQEGFERFAQMAKARGFRLVVGLFDGHRKWPSEGWDDWPAFGTAGDAQDKAYLSAVVGRWKDEPAILAWDLYNEPDFVGDQEFRWAEHKLNRLGWLARMATEVRRLDRNHLLTIGVALAESNFLPGPGGTRVVDLVDFVSVHYYTRNYPGESLNTVLTEMKRLTPKPIIVEEIGQATLIDGVDMSGDDETQVNFLREAMDGAHAADVSGMLVWTLYDFPTHANGSEGYYGLVRADDTWKPAATVFAEP